MRRKQVVTAAVSAVLGIAMLVVVPGVGATTARATATISLSLDRSSIRANGRDSASLSIDASIDGIPVSGVRVKLSALWTTLPGYGALRFHPAGVELDATGHGTSTVTSTRAGSVIITASIAAKTVVGTASIGLDLQRRSMVIFVDGASTSVTCSSPGNCADSTGVLDPVRNALATEGYAVDDMPWFSYAGGVIDQTTHAWIPNASTCADTGESFKKSIGRLRSMVHKVASQNANADISIVGLSEGAAVAFQMLAVQTAPLAKGSRLANVIAIDGPLGGIPLAQVTNLAAQAPSTACAFDGGKAPAVAQMNAVWNSTAPSGKPQQGDNATVLCNVIGYASCAIAETNAEVVASRPDVNVQTWGSSQDGVFNPTVCGIPGSWIDATPSQVVSSAGGGMHAEGTVPLVGICTIDSHIATGFNRATDIATTIGHQD